MSKMLCGRRWCIICGIIFISLGTYFIVDKYIFPPMRIENIKSVIAPIKPRMGPATQKSIPEISEDDYKYVSSMKYLEPSLSKFVQGCLEDNKIDEDEYKIIRKDFDLLWNAHSLKRIEKIKKQLKE